MNEDAFAKMPPVVYGAGYVKPRTEETRVTSTLIITEVQCRVCGQWVEAWLPEDQVAKDADGWSVPPQHECQTVRHYTDPGPRPDGLGACICADWFDEGEADHLPHCPQQAWNCHQCRYANWGTRCSRCGRPRPSAAPEGW